jgi:pSer/pThr/pTyr-binding forkhead associated (FHA) protein
MPARLTLYPAYQPVQRFVLDAAHDHFVGRGTDCDLRVHDRRLSRRHARFSFADGWLLTDLASKNGVRLDGREIHETPLTDGNWISFGGLLARFDVVSEEREALERERTQARWHTTVDLSRSFDPSAGVDALLQQLLDAVLELGDTERCFVMLCDEHGELSVRARMHRGGAPLGAAGFAGSTGALQRALEHRRPVVLCDARADAMLGSRPSVASNDIRALICLPLVVGEQITGVLYLDSSRPGKVFTALDVELLEAFASHAALVVGVASVQTGLAELAQLLPREISREPASENLVRRLLAVLPRPAVVPAPDGAPA